MADQPPGSPGDPHDRASATPDQISLPESPEPPPTLPGRGAYLTVFAAIVAAGVFGGIIGWGITDLGCTGDCTVVTTVGTLVGAVGAAAGVGVIGVLVLRAMSEWKRAAPPGGTGRPGRTGEPESPGQSAKTSRRNPSA